MKKLYHFFIFLYLCTSLGWQVIASNLDKNSTPKNTEESSSLSTEIKPPTEKNPYDSAQLFFKSRRATPYVEYYILSRNAPYFIEKFGVPNATSSTDKTQKDWTLSARIIWLDVLTNRNSFFEYGQKSPEKLSETEKNLWIALNKRFKGSTTIPSMEDLKTYSLNDLIKLSTEEKEFVERNTKEFTSTTNPPDLIKMLSKSRNLSPYAEYSIFARMAPYTIEKLGNFQENTQSIEMQEDRNPSDSIRTTWMGLLEARNHFFEYGKKSPEKLTESEKRLWNALAQRLKKSGSTLPSPEDLKAFSLDDLMKLAAEEKEFVERNTENRE